MNHFRRIYAGTYSRPILFGTGEVLEGKGRGIYRLLLDLDTGELRHEGEPVEADNPSYLCSVSYTHLDVYKRQILPILSTGKSWNRSLPADTAPEIGFPLRTS